MSRNDSSHSDWLRLCLIPGIGDSAIRKLLGAFGLPAQVFAASRTALAHAAGETHAGRVRAALDDAAINAAVEQALTWLSAPENHLVTLADADYPRGLLDTADPPPLLYLKGRRELLGLPAVAIVGSRNATAQGIANAESFADALSRAGLCVVSGLALGIDAAAHRGALRAFPAPGSAPAGAATPAGRGAPHASAVNTGAPAQAGSTIAIIGTGIDIVYPARNRDLAHMIAVHGLIVSEFPLGAPAAASNFPRRNRIISGLSKGVVVIEAALKSGSLITARLAGEQGRDVFALPGSIHSPLSKGCHQLIKQGAKLVDSVDDILEELAQLGPAGRSGTHAAAQPVTVDAAHASLLDALGHEPAALDTLSARTGIATHTLSAQLLELELAGHITPLPGGLVQRITR